MSKKKKKKENRGGKREGAGRPSKYKEPTQAIQARVPVSKVPEIKALISDRLKRYEKEAQNA